MFWVLRSLSAILAELKMTQVWVSTMSSTTAENIQACAT